MVGSSSLSTPAILSFPNIAHKIYFLAASSIQIYKVWHYYLMSINQRQFEQLTEMGISLWQTRNSDNKQSSPNSNSLYLKQSSVTLKKLTEITFFIDILTCFNLSIGEVTPQTDHLDCGLFNWFFSAQINMPTTEPIQWCDNKLISPSIELLSKSPALKKQLWQTIMNNL